MGTAKKKTKVKSQSTAVVRASVSFPSEIYGILKSIAMEKKVSLAWVVRETAEQYIDAKQPLFKIEA